MNPSRVIAPRPARAKAVVKGPIRCHKCQKLCRDAEQYLSHSCAKTGGTGLSRILKQGF